MRDLADMEERLSEKYGEGYTQDVNKYWKQYYKSKFNTKKKQEKKYDDNSDSDFDSLEREERPKKTKVSSPARNAPVIVMPPLQQPMYSPYMPPPLPYGFVQPPMPAYPVPGWSTGKFAIPPPPLPNGMNFY